MAQKRSAHELIVGAVIYAFLAAMYTFTAALPEEESALFPYMILALFALLNTIMVIQAFTGRYSSGFAARDTVVPLLYFAGIMLYILLFSRVGYFPATAAMLAAVMLIFRVRPLWKIALIVAGYSAFVYVLFIVWLKTQIL